MTDAKERLRVIEIQARLLRAELELQEPQSLDCTICGLPLFTSGAKPADLAQVKEILRSLADPFLRRMMQEKKP